MSRTGPADRIAMRTLFLALLVSLFAATPAWAQGAQHSYVDRGKTITFTSSAFDPHLTITAENGPLNQDSAAN